MIVNTAIRHGVQVAIRSFAGHSYVGQSSVGSGGILMVLDQLKSFSVETASDGSFIARIGAGLPLIEVYSRLAMHSPPLGLNGGTCPSVCISGLVSGGGAYPAGGLEGISESKLQAAMQQCLAFDRSEASSTDTKSKSLYLPVEQFLNPEFETEALKLVTQE